MAKIKFVFKKSFFFYVCTIFLVVWPGKKKKKDLTTFKKIGTCERKWTKSFQSNYSRDTEPGCFGMCSIQSGESTPNITVDIGVNGELILIKNKKFTAWLCTGVVVARVAIRKRKSPHNSTSAVYDTSLKVLSTQNPLCRKPILYAHSVRLLEPYIQPRIIVSLNMQTSQSIVGAPWAEMMCKIAFFRSMQAGRGGIMKQTHHKQHWQIV